MGNDELKTEAEEVPWDHPSNTQNPKNWRVGVKLFHIAVPCVLSFLLTFATSVMVPAVDALSLHFDISRTQALLPLTLYTLGIGCGPIFVASLSEAFGRKWLYVATISLFIAFQAGAGAAQTFTQLLVCRWFAGFLGTGGIAMGAGSINDVFEIGDKVSNIASLFFILGPFLGPTFGPLAGAYIFEEYDQNWRWTIWLLLILAGFCLLGALIMKETAKVAIVKVERNVSVFAMWRAAAILPAKMLCTDIIIFSLGLYTAYAYAMVFSFFASTAYVLGTLYHFNRKQVGLSLISVIIGYLLATLMFGIIDKRVIQPARERSPNKKAPPEYNLIPALIGSLFIPASLFWWAWEAHRGGHWAALVAAGIPLGLGAFALFLSVILYLVNIYTDKAASSLAANGILRYTLGAVFPLFTIQMYQNLGVHWASSVFAFLSLALLPIPWLLFRYGPALRARRSKLHAEAAGTP